VTEGSPLPDPPDHAGEAHGPVDDRPRLVRFWLGGRELLVDVAAVREVLVPGPVTRLPGSAPAIAGVTSVRGRIVAVVDASGALGAPASATRDRFLVVAAPEGPVALVVDRVDAVVAAALDEEPDDASPVVTASATIEGRTLPVIDPVALVRAAIAPPTDAAPAGAA
jgi:chemotaxis signal transduction protein